MSIIKQFSIPTLNDTPIDFDKLCEFGDLVYAANSDATFTFPECQFLRPNAIAFLGGIARILESKGRTVRFDFDTAPDKVLTILRQNGFARQFGHSVFSGPGRSVPYREDRIESIRQENIKDNIIDYLANEWLGHGWVHVSQRLKNAIVGVVWEIYDNAFEHANSEIGIYSCGQYFPRMRILKLAVADFGLGIPENVKRYLNLKLPSASCLQWAFQQGASTKTQGMRRGLGLNLLKDFVNLNHGALEIYSQDGYALVSDKKERFHNRNKLLRGTIVNMTIRCDESYYCFTDETSVAPLF